MREGAREDRGEEDFEKGRMRPSDVKVLRNHWSYCAFILIAFVVNFIITIIIIMITIIVITIIIIIITTTVSINVLDVQVLCVVAPSDPPP